MKKNSGTPERAMAMRILSEIRVEILRIPDIIHVLRQGEVSDVSDVHEVLEQSSMWWISLSRPHEFLLSFLDSSRIHVGRPVGDEVVEQGARRRRLRGRRGGRGTPTGRGGRRRGCGWSRQGRGCRGAVIEEVGAQRWKATVASRSGSAACSVGMEWICWGRGGGVRKSRDDKSIGSREGRGAR